MLDAATSAWEPYVSSILAALDTMPAEAEIDLSLLVRYGAGVRNEGTVLTERVSILVV